MIFAVLLPPYKKDPQIGNVLTTEGHFFNTIDEAKNAGEHPVAMVYERNTEDRSVKAISLKNLSFLDIFERKGYRKASFVDLFNELYPEPPEGCKWNLMCDEFLHMGNNNSLSKLNSLLYNTCSSFGKDVEPIDGFYILSGKMHGDIIVHNENSNQDKCFLMKCFATKNILDKIRGFHFLEEPNHGYFLNFHPYPKQVYNVCSRENQFRPYIDHLVLRGVLNYKY